MYILYHSAKDLYDHIIANDEQNAICSAAEIRKVVSEDVEFVLPIGRIKARISLADVLYAPVERYTLHNKNRLNPSRAELFKQYAQNLPYETNLLLMDAFMTKKKFRLCIRAGVPFETEILKLEAKKHECLLIAGFIHTNLIAKFSEVLPRPALTFENIKFARKIASIITNEYS